MSVSKRCNTEFGSIGLTAGGAFDVVGGREQAFLLIVRPFMRVWFANQKNALGNRAEGKSNEIELEVSWTA